MQICHVKERFDSTKCRDGEPTPLVEVEIVHADTLFAWIEPVTIVLEACRNRFNILKYLIRRILPHNQRPGEEP